MQKIRKLKVTRAYADKPKAAIILSGNWLEQAGFTIGKQLEVKVSNQRIIIRANT